MKHKKVSIVMINYNGLRYLKRTIEPILNLDYPNYEFIIVDNGSEDGSIEYIRKFHDIVLIQSPRKREKNFACNYGIKNCSGEYVLLMDNDALITNKVLLKDLTQRYNKNTGVIGLSFYDEGDDRSNSYGSYLGYYYINETPNIKISKLNSYDGCEIGFPEGKALFISKKKWNEAGGYDEELIFGGDDSDLGIKMWLMGYKNYLYSKNIQIHLGLPERQNNKKYALKWKEMFSAHLYTIVKNFTFPNMILTIIGLSIFGFLKSLKQSIQRLHFGTFISYFTGYILFFKKLPSGVKKRKTMESKRRVREDIFLKIRPPKI